MVRGKSPKKIVGGDIIESSKSNRDEKI